jgi:hypothetical protein
MLPARPQNHATGLNFGARCVPLLSALGMAIPFETHRWR